VSRAAWAIVDDFGECRSHVVESVPQEPPPTPPSRAFLVYTPSEPPPEDLPTGWMLLEPISPPEPPPPPPSRSFFVKPPEETSSVNLGWLFVPDTLPPEPPAAPPSRYLQPVIQGEAVQRRQIDIRGVYRIFNASAVRFRRGATPPAEGDTPYAEASGLPATPTNTFANGTWYVAASRFNGCLDSGFARLDSSDRTTIRLDVSDDGGVRAAPDGPGTFYLEVQAGGVVRVCAVYRQTGDLRATQWAITYTTNGATPGEDAPDLTRGIISSGPSVLLYDLPAQEDGTVVKVRLQTRRNDGTDGDPLWVYSDGSVVLTATADAVVTDTPPAGDEHE